MNNSSTFDSKSAEFYSGLSEAQLAGSAPFDPGNSSRRIASSFASRAAKAFVATDKPLPVSDTEPMTDITDYRHELKLRDDSLRKELDLRQESFRAEQAVRDKALDDKFSGFFSAQAERDKSWEKISEARFDRIEKDVASIKTEAKAVTAELHSMKVTMAKYFGGAIVIGAIASAILGAALKHLLP